MSTSLAGRSVFRSSSSFLSSTARATSRSRPSSLPRLRLSSSPPRIFRITRETSFCVESLMPMHSATASSLMRSMLSVRRGSYGWLLEGKDETR